MVLLSFWNYFYDKKKLFSRTQYAKREAVDGDKEAKVSDERDKVVQEMAMFYCAVIDTSDDGCL